MNSVLEWRRVVIISISVAPYCSRFLAITSVVMLLLHKINDISIIVFVIIVILGST